jgi:2'-5' RNA ligase
LDALKDVSLSFTELPISSDALEEDAMETESQSALLVVVPEAESLVRDLRSRYDPSATLGVPAHITLLFPFLSPDTIGETERNTLTRIFARTRSFDFQLKRIGTFSQTVYLAPEPAESFMTLTTALVDEFPLCPPYGGRFTEVVPHLTVSDGDPLAIEVVESQLRARMSERGPIHAICDEVHLYRKSSGYWRCAETYELAHDA